MYDFGMRLREMRKKAGMTQLVLAGLVGVSKGLVSAWELGTRHPSLDEVARLAIHTGCDPAYVFVKR